MRPTKLEPVNIQLLSEEGKRIYGELKETLDAEHKGKYLAIEVESGDYFLGETIEEAGEKARKQHPDKIFYLVRIGYPGVFNLSTFASSQSV